MNQIELTLLPSTLVDLAQLVSWEKQAEVEEFILPNTYQQHVDMMAQDNFLYLSIFQSDRLVGFLILAIEAGGGIEFRRIVIGHRGQGLGQLAIQAMEYYCLEHFACQRIWLDVFDFNERGQHIYRKLGYQEFKRCQHGEHQLLFFEKHF
ncbi:N-acetyltransferase [Pseudoalteromonas phenolica]|uniref:N-acetyltransferase n=1 Tax=Pseudoalteromonas phenolica TaxID=161398 RepID=A0A5S3YW41_9GAMM|nr:GNAT family protein [Pseudoalteromonas phenolica]TMP82029.1 N-acetyltransferase [Pseudoalteromonas phenolica]